MSIFPSSRRLSTRAHPETGFKQRPRGAVPTVSKYWTEPQVPELTGVILEGPRQKPHTQRDRAYKILELPNRLKGVLVSDARCDKAAVAVTVHVGSLCEKPFATHGLAHFLEHMLFLGTEKYPAEDSYKKFVAKHAGRCNASTGDDWTRYHLSIAPDFLGEAVDRISQFFLHPLMSQSCTEREMKAVDSEHKKNLQNDSRRALQVFRCEADPTHPLHHFRTGDISTLQKEGIRDILLQFHMQFYSANLMAVSIYGRESLEELEVLLRSGFENVRDTTASIPDYDWAFSKYRAIFKDEQVDGKSSITPVVVYIEPVKEVGA